MGPDRFKKVKERWDLGSNRSPSRSVAFSGMRYKKRFQV